ncbi:hypothetical protein L208DRAFT_878895, partial [Tricholoma matsutake]
YNSTSAALVKPSRGVAHVVGIIKRFEFGILGGLHVFSIDVGSYDDTHPLQVGRHWIMNNCKRR